VVLCQLGATVCALVGVELALRGHLSPGGGFAAGVAGGTAIGLLLISGSVRLADRLYRRYRADLWEKAAVVAFVLVALLALEGLVPGSGVGGGFGNGGGFGQIDSGGWIPLLNVLVAVKVTLGGRRWCSCGCAIAACSRRSPPARPPTAGAADRGCW
jgi:multicomponent Na+:H+ antiporter subunit B